MKKKLSLLLLVCATLLSSCIGNKQSTSSTAGLIWSKLTILTERSTKVNITNDRDSAVVILYNTGSFFNPHSKDAYIDTLSTFFTSSEKDSLASLARDLIVNPAKIKGFCTEFVGDLQLSLYYGEQFNLSCHYSSVCNWSELSDKTKLFNNILQRRLKPLYNISEQKHHK
ncbi:hypothetical protein [Mucilaginibacter flavus]|uniref:hypothetical protein n=1 Tax=Mucilaginibacter flavus TaxID=931504 RepID=UPI0025B4AAB5|nr:hypothetical protein [Mucilaginibacter flavus]MDN3585027.1 hypothetical protein [Mucilaginibacter flavus]